MSANKAQVCEAMQNVKILLSRRTIKPQKKSTMVRRFSFFFSLHSIFTCKNGFRLSKQYFQQLPNR